MFIVIFMASAFIMTPINNNWSFFSFLFSDDGLDDEDMKRFVVVAVETVQQL